ncbi:hypothetical protein EJ07DRAFT_152407 [Lizonia empirigonia]|nr:hypothetical protein EJ07DRAFT_152407 [Lizonia empirigonia]
MSKACTICCFEDAPSRRWDTRFRARETKADRFFKAGRVFAMLWDEATENVDAFLSPADRGETPLVESTLGRSFASIRRFVVVPANRNSAIFTYGNRRRHGTHKHATAYNTGTMTGMDDVEEALEEHRNGHRLLKHRMMPPSIAVSNGHSGATSPFEDMEEHVRPQTGQMFAYARDTALLVGQISQKLSTSLLEPMIDPSPAVFVTAYLVFGALVTTHYHYNRDSITQKPLLVAGTVAGVVASAFCCQNGGFIQNTAAIVPVLVIVCLLLGHLVDTITQCVLGSRQKVVADAGLPLVVHETITSSQISSVSFRP